MELPIRTDAQLLAEHVHGGATTGLIRIVESQGSVRGRDSVATDAQCRIEPGQP